MSNQRGKLHGYPYWRKADGSHVIKAGKWYIEYGKKYDGIYAYSIYAKRDNYGHQIPCELREGKPYYPFGISHLLPVYAKQAIDLLVIKFGVERQR